MLAIFVVLVEELEGMAVYIGDAFVAVVLEIIQAARYWLQRHFVHLSVAQYCEELEE